MDRRDRDQRRARVRRSEQADPRTAQGGNAALADRRDQGQARPRQDERRGARLHVRAISGWHEQLREAREADADRSEAERRKAKDHDRAAEQAAEYYW